MVNLEHKLTVDDLIVEYMMYKVKNGYEPSFLGTEFITFLHYFESKMEVDDCLYDSQKLFERFFERKGKRNWSRSMGLFTEERMIIPHMDIKYNVANDDCLIKANYKLSDYDSSIINTYFMNKSDVEKIRGIIQEFLKKQPKRKIDIITKVDENSLLIGKYIAAGIIDNIWKSHINKLVEYKRWPKQCNDINKYLLDMDLAKLIEEKSIKEDLLKFYIVISNRLAVMYRQDKKLKISSYSNVYLANANYKLLINGYEDMFGIAFGEYKSALEIDVEKLKFSESHEIDGVYDYDDDIPVKTTTVPIENEKVKKMVMNFDKNIQKY